MPDRLIALRGAEHLAASFAERARLRPVRIETRRFPDGESYFRVLEEIEGDNVVVLAAMSPADRRVLPALFALSTIREFGARSVGVVVPYLPYLRQDRRFRSGEAVSARLFGELFADRADWLVTLDPHLHRLPDLDSVFPIPSAIASAAEPMARWIAANAPGAVLVGPDDESAQWIEPIAASLGVEHFVLDKVRTGDRSVEISGVAGRDLTGREVVLVDDIISSGMTMARAAEALRGAGAQSIDAVASHALFAGGSEAAMRAAGIDRIATSDALAHATNAFSVVGPLATGVARMMERPE